MGKSEKSEIESENISFLRFPVSPNFFSRMSNSKPDFYHENTGIRSPIVGQYRLPRPNPLARFASPNQNSYSGRSEYEFISLVNHEFDLQMEAGKEYYERQLPFIGSQLTRFSPIQTRPILALTQPKEVTNNIFTQSKMIFNPFKAAHSPINKNLLLQDIISRKSNDKTSRILSFSLQKLNVINKKQNQHEENEKSESDGDVKIETKAAHKKSKKIKKAEHDNPSHIKVEAPRKKNIKCNCKNSECLNDYCECFKNRGYCDHLCNCRRCRNVKHEKAYPSLKVKIGTTLKATSLPSFERPVKKIELRMESIDTPRFEAGAQNKCNCKKSMCLKKYCECFSSGAFCSPACNCLQCSNFA
jgi:hypothetical protein